MLITELASKGMLASKNNPLTKKRGYIFESAEVESAQNILMVAGYELPKFGADGVFGDETETVVKAFQEDHGLKSDGIIGPKTLNEMMYYAYKDFTKDEFACNCETYCSGFPVDLDEDLLVLLQNIRDYFRKPVVITSAIRCKQHNENVGGVAGSQHLYGKAADIKVIGVSASDVYFYADKINPNGGVGRYNTFTHVDARGEHKRFDYRK